MLICTVSLATVTQSDESQSCAEPGMKGSRAWETYVDRKQLSGFQG